MSKHKSIPLEIDSSIIERNVSFVNNNPFEEDLKSMFANNEQESMLVKPLPGFCLKTKSSENKKIFVNICHTDAIPSPIDISEDELIGIIQTDEQVNYRIPMSIGEGRIENDKSGQPSDVYDVAISTKFFEKLKSSEIFQKFIIRVVLEGVQYKHQPIEIDSEEYVILKNRKHVGTLQTQRLQKRITESAYTGKPCKPLIEEIITKNYVPVTNNSKIENQTETKKGSYTKIDFHLSRVPEKGKIDYIVAEYKIKKNLDPGDIILDIGEDRIVVEIPKTKQLSDIFIPYIIKQETVVAVYSANANVLIIVMKAKDSNTNYD